MKTKSCKAKGRRAASEARDILLKYAPDLRPDDIMVTPSGMNGPDLHLSPKARERFPIVPECKNTESIQIWAAFEQAKSNCVFQPGFQVPTLFFRRNRSELMVALRAEDFVKLIG